MNIQLKIIIHDFSNFTVLVTYQVTVFVCSILIETLGGESETETSYDPEIEPGWQPRVIDVLDDCCGLCV